MEIYLETPQEVTIPMPTGFETTSVLTTIIKDGVTPAPIAAVTAGDDFITAKIPYAALMAEGSGQIKVVFTIDSVLREKFIPFEVVTPYLTILEARKILGPEATVEEIKEVEQAVRYIINAHCGQSFGKKTKTNIVVGAGENALALPERLISISGIKTLSAVLNPSALIVIADGWYLKKKRYDAISDINNTSLYWEGEGVYDTDDFVLEAPHGLGHTPDRFSHGRVISAPNSFSGTKWKDDYPFSITGDWGYEAIPRAVIEAAKLLMNDYACSEQMYRDRYLDSIKSADWRLQYNDKAFLQTGNVRADQLLSDYVMKRGWAVI